MSDNWHLEVKFQGRPMTLVGRLPAEKRTLLKEFPRKLALSTRAKLAAIPSKGFFCKFVAKHVEELKVYMLKNECALCVNFVASTYNFTLYLIVPVSLRGLKCLHRLKKSGAPPESIKSLCTDREGVVIGFIVSEVNHELEEKLVEREKAMQEIVSTAKAISHTFGGDPLLEFDLLMDQLEMKPSTIPVRLCSMPLWWPLLMALICVLRLAMDCRSARSLSLSTSSSTHGYAKSCWNRLMRLRAPRARPTCCFSCMTSSNPYVVGIRRKIAMRKCTPRPWYASCKRPYSIWSSGYPTTPSKAYVENSE
jgi:hypothetical protein